MSRLGTITHDQFPTNICIPHSTVGENVGWSWGGSESGDLQRIDSGMMSEPHDATTCARTHNHACTILSKVYRQVGIGIYHDRGGTWLTEDFTA